MGTAIDSGEPLSDTHHHLPSISWQALHWFKTKFMAAKDPPDLQSPASYVWLQNVSPRYLWTEDNLWLHKTSSIFLLIYSRQLSIGLDHWPKVSRNIGTTLYHQEFANNFFSWSCISHFFALRYWHLSQSPSNDFYDNLLLCSQWNKWKALKVEQVLCHVNHQKYLQGLALKQVIDYGFTGEWHRKTQFSGELWPFSTQENLLQMVISMHLHAESGLSFLITV